MWATSRRVCDVTTRSLCRNRDISAISRRHFLTPAFNCENEWQSRLSSPALSKLDLNRFFVDVERKFNNEKRGSSIDIDLFSNKASSETEMEQLEELLHQMRRTPQTINTTPSTHYAVVRTFIRAGLSDNLMRILGDPLNYGLFPDDASLVFLLNHFVLQENWRDAAKVGIHMMLQENETATIGRELAIYSCYMYVKHPKEGEVWEPQADPPEEEPEDEVKVRVKYLEPDAFDDHFDLKTKEAQIGKTLVYLTRLSAGERTAADDSLVAVGLTLWEKWTELGELLQSKSQLSSESVDLCKSLLEANEKCSVKDELIAKLDSATKTDLDVESELKKAVSSSVEKNESQYVSWQKEAFERWSDQRSAELEKQYELYLIESRKDEIARKKRDLEDREKRLFFFENEEKWEGELEEKKTQVRRTAPPKTWSWITLKPKEVVADDYVSPDTKYKPPTD